jgi:hypothetical protein
MNKWRPSYRGFLFGLVVLAACGRTLFAEPQAPLNEDDWFVVKMQDKKCGYMHGTTRTVGKEVHTQSVMMFEIARGPAKVKITVDQKYLETLDGKPLGFVQTMNLGQMPITVRGTVKGKKIVLSTTQGQATNEVTHDFDPEIKFAWGLRLEEKRHGIKEGTTFSAKTYEPSLKPDGPIEIKVKIHEKGPVNVLGKKLNLWRTTATMNLATPIVSESWMDDEARPIVSSFDLGVVKVMVYQSTREEALADSDVAPEMFMTTLINAKGEVPKGAKALKLRLTLPGDGGLKMPDIPNTSMQSYERVNDQEGILTIKRLDWKAIRRIKSDSNASSASMKEYLRASTMLDVRDARIKRLAKRGAGRADTPAKKADSLRKFVTEYISDKNMNIGFATASEVARNKAGDCSEHGVLLAALARAAGLPARGVSGIVAVPDGAMGLTDGKAFGYHMWTQVNIGGEWVDIDAALRETDCNPTHIALSLMPLNDEGMAGSITSLLPLIGRLQIEVISADK